MPALNHPYSPNSIVPLLISIRLADTLTEKARARVLVLVKVEILPCVPINMYWLFAYKQKKNPKVPRIIDKNNNKKPIKRGMAKKWQMKHI